MQYFKLLENDVVCDFPPQGEDAVRQLIKYGWVEVDEESFHLYQSKQEAKLKAFASAEVQAEKEAQEAHLKVIRGPVDETEASKAKVKSKPVAKKALKKHK